MNAIGPMHEDVLKTRAELTSRLDTEKSTPMMPKRLYPRREVCPEDYSMVTGSGFMNVVCGIMNVGARAVNKYFARP